MVPKDSSIGSARVSNLEILGSTRRRRRRTSTKLIGVNFVIEVMVLRWSCAAIAASPTYPPSRLWLCNMVCVERSIDQKASKTIHR